MTAPRFQPFWSRCGARARAVSTSTTRAPWLAAAHAAQVPAGPPPLTSTPLSR